MSSLCPVCGRLVERRGRRGPAPTYCSQRHRQKAYEQRNPPNDRIFRESAFKPGSPVEMMRAKGFIA